MSHMRQQMVTKGRENTQNAAELFQYLRCIPVQG
ncbi:hypothetical protein RD1_1882 [Roseobacter denitrificans OCh 114]|uniref:Uncharacterized protein n=1 Tax=Roseobacter denitrificans (strain ATCC 33942 / OCh 114) TaxID=375451 RepID=Q168V0_ROSDO|nr:hypothetical protein RD1_1882 [Roseobacter denitrificans OCh 114]